MVCSILITISLPYSVPTIPCAHLRGSSFGEAEKIYVLVVELLDFMKILNRALQFEIIDSEVLFI